MKKYLMLIAAVALSIMGLAVPASATGGDYPSADNKKVTFCHYRGSDDHGGSGKYNKMTTSVMAFYTQGHIGHSNDIWEAFSYTTVGGDVVNVPAQGDTSLLAFDDCEAPEELEKVTKPEAVYVDKCGTENDVFSVAPGRGYTVGDIQTDGVIQSITVTLNEGFTWIDETTTPLRFERPVFTDVPCGLPDTGGSATYATSAGIGALGALIAAGMLTFFASRRRTI